jgi:hypothetical protein
MNEVDPGRPYLKSIPAAWKIGTNFTFNSIIIDQSQPGWPDFFSEQVVRPLWNKGWRGLFLDTLDSYQLVAKTPEAMARQEAGMVAVVRTLRARFPGIKLFFNRGFEILPQVYTEAYAVAAESLYRLYDHGGRRYGEVTAAHRTWLSGQLANVRDNYKLPVVVIDYVPAADRTLALTTARRIAAEGFIPFVSTPGFDTLGVGALDIAPQLPVSVTPAPAASPLRRRGLLQ